MSCTNNIFSSTIGRWQAREDLIKKQKTPLGLSGIILELLKDHFSYNSKQFKYIENDQTLSKISIDLHEHWEPNNPSSYPGIYVKRDQWTPRATARVMGDLARTMNPNAPHSTEFWVPVLAQYTLKAVAKKDGQLEVLVDETASFLTYFKFYIEQYLAFHKFENTNVGGTSLINEPQEHYMCPLSLIMEFDLSWRIALEQPIIKNVQVVNEGN